mmetsp:Transcript_18895/g.44764  ORF Transcript_18895/g.44764 Transcript_18895/m.44764 type:complete len:219 (+) Transcript_18895:294-950(+)
MYSCSRCCPRVCNVDDPTCSESAQRACDSNRSRSDSRMAWSVAVSAAAARDALPAWSVPTPPCLRSVLSNVGARYPLLALISATLVSLAAVVAAAFLADPPPNNSFRSLPRPSPILLLVLVGALVLLVMEEVLPVRLASRARATSSANGLTSWSIRRFDSCTLAASPSTSARPCMAVAHLRASRSSRSDSCSVDLDLVDERNARTRDKAVSYSVSNDS